MHVAKVTLSPAAYELDGLLAQRRYPASTVDADAARELIDAGLARTFLDGREEWLEREDTALEEQGAGSGDLITVRLTDAGKARHGGTSVTGTLLSESPTYGISLAAYPLAIRPTEVAGVSILVRAGA